MVNSGSFQDCPTFNKPFSQPARGVYKDNLGRDIGLEVTRLTALTHERRVEARQLHRGVGYSLAGPPEFFPSV